MYSFMRSFRWPVLSETGPLSLFVFPVFHLLITGVFGSSCPGGSVPLWSTSLRRCESESYGHRGLAPRKFRLSPFPGPGVYRRRGPLGRVSSDGPSLVTPKAATALEGPPVSIRQEPTGTQWLSGAQSARTGAGVVTVSTRDEVGNHNERGSISYQKRRAGPSGPSP